jgi:hypothetical protein
MTGMITLNCIVDVFAMANCEFEESDPGYDPDLPVPRWHQTLELAVLCITNGLSRKSKS